MLFVSDWSERGNDPNAFGLTAVWHDTRTGEILDADMELNETLGPFGICPVGASCEVVDIQNVVTHEAGHFFGLGHSRERFASMYGSSRRGETIKRTLKADDVEGFCATYPPGSLPDACDFAPRGGLTRACWSPGVRMPSSGS